MEAILAKCRDAVARGATEVCIQGGIHPNKDHTHYHEILTTVKGAFPDLHIHAYSPEEIDFGHRKSGMELADYLRWLVDAGLGTMPGTAAEILDDEIREHPLAEQAQDRALGRDHPRRPRASVCARTSTLMYGHIEEPRHVAGHLELLREHPEGHGRLHGVRARSASSTSATCSTTSSARVPAPRCTRTCA